MLPPQIQKFITYFSKLPGLGPRAANRLAFYLTGLERERLELLIASLNDLKKINKCKQCFFLKDASSALCHICGDKTRSSDLIAIVEKETDLLTIEKTAVFKGRYFIIGELNDKGIIEPNQKMRLQYLKNRIKNTTNSPIQEIILALNPNTLSDTLYEMIKDEFKGLAQKITTLGRGIPTGGEIEFADEDTIIQALKRRSS